MIVLQPAQTNYFVNDRRKLDTVWAELDDMNISIQKSVGGRAE
jgi:hypothetical protein